MSKHKGVRKITTKTVKYRCPVCKTDYDKHADAQKCAGFPVMKPMFNIGDKVTAYEMRRCQMTRGDGPYKVTNGEVVEILGPQAPDVEYICKWISEVVHRNMKMEMLKSHYYTYLVRFVCPKCGETREEVYYWGEIEKNKTKTR